MKVMHLKLQHQNFSKALYTSKEEELYDVTLNLQSSQTVGLLFVFKLLLTVSIAKTTVNIVNASQ